MTNLSNINIPTFGGTTHVWAGHRTAVVVTLLGAWAEALVASDGKWSATGTSALPPGTHTPTITLGVNSQWSRSKTLAPIIIKPLAPHDIVVTDEGLSPLITGKSWPLASLSLKYSDRDVSHTIGALANGTWSFRRDKEFTPGNHTFSVTQTFGGQTSPAFGPRQFNVATPAVTIIQPKTGDEVTLTPTISGTGAYGGAVVKIFDATVADKLLGEQPVDADGKLQLLAAGSTEGVRDVDVEWETPSGVVSSRTGLEGWTEFEYTPKVAGPGTLIARVKARDDNDEAQIEAAFNFTAIQSNSWKAHAELTLDPANHIGPADRMDFYCHRGGSLTLHLKPVPGGKLLNQKVGLRWRRTDPNLGLTFSRPLDQTFELTDAGLAWAMTADAEHSGWLELDFYTESAEVPQAWELTGRLMSKDLLDEGRVEFDSLVEPILPTSKSYPCIGAEHAIRFMPNSQAPLSGLALQLLATPQKVDPRTLGIVFNPDLTEDLLITTQGTEWAMDCSDCESAATFELDVKLIAGSKTLSSVSSFKMDLGHNRLKLSESRDPTILPVIANQEAAYVRHRVCSYYTGEPVAGVPVLFAHQGGGERLVPSRADGWAPYAFKPETLDEKKVTASVHNRYNNESVTVESTVEAVQSEPWGDMRIKNAEEPDQSTLGEKTQFPRRGERSVYRIAPVVLNHPTVGQKVWFGCTGTPMQDLGGNPDQPLGGPRIMQQTGLDQGFTFADKQDGSFGLFVACEKLLELSPTNPMSLGTYSTDSGGES